MPGLPGSEMEAEGSMPREPVSMEASSDRMSPKMLPARTKGGGRQSQPPAHNELKADKAKERGRGGGLV